MADFEVALTTESSGENFCISVWDLSSGMQLKSYKGGSCSPHGLSVVGNNYIMAAQLNKPILHLWNTAKEQVHMKLICPSKVTAAVCSPDAKFCVVSCSEKIYIWQIATGNLLAVLSRHYQCVTCLKFTDDGSHFISGGEDNLVMVWKLVRVVSNSQMQNWSQSCDTDRGPIYTWSDHSLPIMDLHCGCGGMRAHVVTASLDQTCKLYDLGSGQLLCSFVFSCGISAVVMDAAEWNLFAGAIDGNIYQVQLYKPGIMKQEAHIAKEDSLIFQGHRKQVTSVAVSTDCGLLLSGSTDSTARVWHIPSRQCLRTVNHRGSVTNGQIIPKPLYLTNPPPRPQWTPVQPFRRHISIGAPSSAGCTDVSNDNRGAQPSEAPGGIPIVLSGTLHNDSFCESKGESEHRTAREKLLLEVNQTSNSVNGDSPQRTRQQLEEEVERLKKVNREFYSFAVEELLTEVRNVNQKENT